MFGIYYKNIIQIHLYKCSLFYTGLDYIGVTWNREPIQLENAIAIIPHTPTRKLPLSIDVPAK